LYEERRTLSPLHKRLRRSSKTKLRCPIQLNILWRYARHRHDSTAGRLLPYQTLCMRLAATKQPAVPVQEQGEIWTSRRHSSCWNSSTRFTGGDSGVGWFHYSISQRGALCGADAYE